MNILVVIAYDGSTFHGYQKQKAALTVQEEVEKALCSLYRKERLIITGAGRTDAGVHALHQVINFKVKGQKVPQIAPERVAAALNQHLPSSIRAITSRKVRGAFHARFYARYKTYNYFFYTGPSSLPFLEGKAWYAATALDTQTMHEVLPVFLGKHDFTSFANRGSSQRSGICTLKEIQLLPTLFAGYTFYRVQISADRFLYHMVRNIVGTLYEVSLRKVSVDDIEKRLAHPDPFVRKFTAPPQGLYLTYVHYEEADIHSGFSRHLKRQSSMEVEE